MNILKSLLFSVFIVVEFPEPFATIRMGDTCFMCINWGTSERLAAGLTNGTIAVWDMKLMLSQTKETLAEKDSGMCEIGGVYQKLTSVLWIPYVLTPHVPLIHGIRN